MHTSWDIRYCTYISGYWRPSLIFPVTLASKSIHSSSIVLLDLKMVWPVGSLVISRWNPDIPFTSGLTDAILDFCGRGLKYCETWDIRKNVLVMPYRSGKTSWQISNTFRRLRVRGSFCKNVYGKRRRKKAKDDEKQRKTTNGGERQRTTTKNGERRRQTAKNGESWRKTVNDGERQRKTAKNREDS